jgi:recombination protein RecR
MPEQAKPMVRLIDALRRLPGLGPKSAQRIAFHILKGDRHEADEIADAIRDLKDKIRLCDICNNVTETNPCAYCSDVTRNPRLLCIVEEPGNVLPIERTGQYRGYYHVLHGALSPLQGIGPEQLRITNLIERMKSGAIQEVIVATNPTVDGEATAAYLSRILKPHGVMVSRIAMGVPVGGDLEYVDEVTIAKAMEGRKEI